VSNRPNNSALRVAAGAAVVVAAAAAVYIAAGGLGPRKDILPPDDSLRIRRTDPNLIAYVETDGIPTGMNAPRGLALDKQDRVYVAGDSLVRVFDVNNGASVREFPTGGGATSLAVGPREKVFVAFKNRVEAYDRNGVRLSAWQDFDPNSMFSSITPGGAGVFLADDNTAKILWCDANGRVAKRIGRGEANESILLRSPHFDVALGPDDFLWITNPGRLRVEAYDADDDRVAAWGKATEKIDGFSGCCNPKDIAFLPSGDIVVSEKGLPRVKVYDRSGKFLCVVAGTESFDQDVPYLDLAVDSKGRVLVLDPAQKKVRIFVRKGPE